jgi:NADPH:quinone reductase-like Zn-dependent oxidoreductase
VGNKSRGSNASAEGACAIANPGMSAWAALKERARLGTAKAVLVNGATGTADRLAVQIAKYMGARRVVATGRNEQTLKAPSVLGADVIIPLGDGDDAFEDALKEQFDGIDVVSDYLWGPSAERIIIAGAKANVPIRFVHIGSVSAPDITLPSAALRSSAITLLGVGSHRSEEGRYLPSLLEQRGACGRGPLHLEAAWNARLLHVDEKTGGIAKLKQLIANFVDYKSPVAGGCPILNTATDTDDGNPACGRAPRRPFDPS